MAFGPAAASWRASVAITLACLVATAALSAVEAWGGDDRDRCQALGLLCFVAAILTLALICAAGGPVRVYRLFAWELYSQRRLATFVRTGLLVMACALVPSNTSRGLAARD